MVKRDGHIDLVFRDGLKNFEVLPPADIWDSVSSQISPIRNSAWIFRIAAGIAAMISLGLLAYFVGIKSSEAILPPLSADSQTQTDRPDILTLETETPPVLADAGRQLVNNNTNNQISAEIIRHDNIIPPVLNNDDIQATDPSVSGINISESRVLNVVRTENDIPNKLSFGIIDDQIGESLIAIENMSEQKPLINKWMLGAKISPTYLSSNLKTANNLFNSENSDESALLSYTGGLSVVYAVGGRLSLQTGVFYSSLGRQVSDINSYSGYANYSESKGGKIFGVSTSTGTIASTNKDFFLVDASGSRISSISSAQNFDPDKAGLDLYGNSLRQNFEYLEIPLMLSYKLIDRKIDFNIMGGMSYSFLLDNNVYAVSEGALVPIGTMEDLAGLLLSSAFGMSMNYSLNENFSLNLEPSLRYYLNSEGSLSASNNPFTFGIFSGVYYKF